MMAFFLGFVVGVLLLTLARHITDRYSNDLSRRRELRVTRIEWKGGELLICGWLGNGENHWVTGRGSGTVWRFSDGRRCPAWLEEQFDEIWACENWKKADAQSQMKQK